jgi:hypothetical protein
MKAIARALIRATAFLALADDDVVDPDAAVRALEDIGHFLHGCTSEEITVLRTVLTEERAQGAQLYTRQEVLAFYDSFLSNFGLADRA